MSDAPRDLPESWLRHIAELVDRAPPLAPAQRDQLAVLLRQEPAGQPDNEAA